MNQDQIPNDMNQIDQNNLNAVNSTVNQVPPIMDVKIEASDSNTANQETKTTDEISNPNPINDGGNSSNQSPKKGNTSTILVILLFIFLFAFVMGMPYIREFMNGLKEDTGLSQIEQAARDEEDKQKQEEESKKPTPTPESEKTKELVCTSTATTTDNYTLVKTQKFYYNSKNKVLSSKNTSNYTFTTTDEFYNNLVKHCVEDVLKYLSYSGYTMACSYGDVNVEISDQFDLKTFKPIVDGTTNIQANATYQQNLNEIKATLTSQGYTCK